MHSIQRTTFLLFQLVVFLLVRSELIDLKLIIRTIQLKTAKSTIFSIEIRFYLSIVLIIQPLLILLSFPNSLIQLFKTNIESLVLIFILK